MDSALSVGRPIRPYASGTPIPGTRNKHCKVTVSGSCAVRGVPMDNVSSAGRTTRPCSCGTRGADSGWVGRGGVTRMPFCAVRGADNVSSVGRRTRPCASGTSVPETRNKHCKVTNGGSLAVPFSRDYIVPSHLYHHHHGYGPVGTDRRRDDHAMVRCPARTVGDGHWPHVDVCASPPRRPNGPSMGTDGMVTVRAPHGRKRRRRGRRRGRRRRGRCRASRGTSSWNGRYVRRRDVPRSIGRSCCFVSNAR